MARIRYNFNNVANLRTMAPPTTATGFGNAALPPGLAGRGLYIIANTDTDNWYVGTSNDLARRFGKRMEVITEMGFSTAQMGDLAAYWGYVSYSDTPPPGVPPVSRQPANYRAPLRATIDGKRVNLERLLIRFMMTQMGSIGTLSNNCLVGDYLNQGSNAIHITLQLSSVTFNAVWNPDTWW